MKDGADSSREAMGLGNGWVKEWNRTGISIIRIISTSWQRPHSFSCDAILPLLYFPLFSAFRWLLYAISLSLSLRFFVLFPLGWLYFLLLVLPRFSHRCRGHSSMHPVSAGTTNSHISFRFPSSMKTSSRWFFCLGNSALNRVQGSSKNDSRYILVIVRYTRWFLNNRIIIYCRKESILKLFHFWLGA